MELGVRTFRVKCATAFLLAWCHWATQLTFHFHSTNSICRFSIQVREHERVRCYAHSQDGAVFTNGGILSSVKTHLHNSDSCSADALFQFSVL